jgi:hypothetical protein
LSDERKFSFLFYRPFPALNNAKEEKNNFSHSRLMAAFSVDTKESEILSASSSVGRQK